MREAATDWAELGGWSPDRVGLSLGHEQPDPNLRQPILPPSPSLSSIPVQCSAHSPIPPSRLMFTQTIDPQLRFRQAVQSPTASLSYIQRLSLKLSDLRNTDPATRQTSLALAALAGRIDVCLWLIEEGHDEDEISAVSRLGRGRVGLRLWLMRGRVGTELGAGCRRRDDSPHRGRARIPRLARDLSRPVRVSRPDH